MSDKLKSLLTSRRFWLLSLGVYNTIYGDVTPVLNAIQGQGDLLLTAILSSWIIGDSVRKTE